MEKTAEIPVLGMSCEHCVKAVTNALSSNSAVRDVKVSLENKNVRVVYDDEITSLTDIEAIIIEEGYSTKEE